MDVFFVSIRGSIPILREQIFLNQGFFPIKLRFWPIGDLWISNCFNFSHKHCLNTDMLRALESCDSQRVMKNHGNSSVIFNNMILHEEHGRVCKSKCSNMKKWEGVAVYSVVVGTHNVNTCAYFAFIEFVINAFNTGIMWPAVVVGNLNEITLSNYQNEPTKTDKSPCI